MDVTPALGRCRIILSSRRFGAVVRVTALGAAMLGLHRLNATKDVERART